MQHQLLPSVAPWVTIATTLAAMIVSCVLNWNHYISNHKPLSLLQPWTPLFPLSLFLLSTFTALLHCSTLFFPLLSLPLSFHSSSSIHLAASSAEALATPFLPQGLPSHPYTLCLCFVSLWMARSWESRYDHHHTHVVHDTLLCFNPKTNIGWGGWDEVCGGD